MQAFEPYLDLEDLSACVGASEPAGSLNERCASLGCHFPLWLDPAQSLGDLFLEARATPAGFRYGSVGDNVLGLQWSLPNGRDLRLGGRVVKNVTGFDFIRFLNASRGRFGTPKLLVLRLRPLAEAELCLRLAGPWSSLKPLARRIRSSSWAHVLDVCDLHAGGSGGALMLLFRAGKTQLSLFQSEAEAWARDCGAQIERIPVLAGPDARPWARIQAPLDDCLDIAKDWLEDHGTSVHGFLGQGVLQLAPPAEGGAVRAESDLKKLHHRMGLLGGHCEHPSLTDDPNAAQAKWQNALKALLSAVA